MRRAASMPSSFGILTSRTATSGRSVRASSTASSPSRASAQTSKPARSSSARRSSRMIVSSSATRILISGGNLTAASLAMPSRCRGSFAAATVLTRLLEPIRLNPNGQSSQKRSAEGCWSPSEAAMQVMRQPMSESDFTSPKPLVLRIEISAEHAHALAPLFEGAASPAAPLPAAPLTEEVVDERVLELQQRETELVQREAEFEVDVQFREDRIERWRGELEELEQTLERRERDLVSYVDQLQGAMSSPGSDAWWSRPLGGDGGVAN